MKIIRPVPITDANLTSSNQAALDSGISAYNSGTTYAQGDLAIVNSPSATVTISQAAPAVITWNAHYMTEKTPVVFTTDGVLPTGITAGRAYFIHSIIDANRFRISASIGGAPIVTTSAGSGTHTCTASTHFLYESLQAGNTGNVPRVPESVWWVKVSSTNRWAMFDTTLNSVTTGSSVEVVIDFDSLVDSVVLLNLSASSVTVVIEDDSEGEVYNETHDLTATSGIITIWDYLFEPVYRDGALYLSGLPPVINGTITITVTEISSDALVQVGTCVIGSEVEVGGTQYGAGVGLQDYSTIDENDYGFYGIQERSFSDTGSLQVYVENSKVDMVVRLLKSLRATACVYIGSDDFKCTFYYGFPSDWNMTIPYTTHSILNIEIKGLT